MRVLGHRGASRVAPENTMAAFSRAIEMGADGVEFDVHRTRDGALVVHHDAASPELGLLAELDEHEIRAALPHVPVLAEVLDLCAGRLVNIEIKNVPGGLGFDPDERTAAAVAELVDARGHRDEVLVSSFGMGAIDRVRALDGRIPTGLLTIVGSDLDEMLTAARDHGHRALNPDVRSLGGAMAAEVADRAHAAGLAVYPWTVDEPDEIRRLAVAGVDGVITNVPDVARAALRG